MKALPLAILMSLFLCPQIALAKDKKETNEKKSYSQEEFEEEVHKRVKAKILALRGNKLVDFSKGLLEKERVLRIKDLDVGNREKALSLQASSFEKRLKEFQESQSNLIACIDQQDKQKKDRVTHMVDVISGMKPAKAAEVLSVQDSEISVQILSMLEAVKVSKIFNLMDKEISARLQKQYLLMKK